MKRDLAFFTDHEMKDSFGDFRDVYDHEVYMSFTNDGGGYAFNDWWSEVGRQHFKDWCATQLDELSEIYG